MYYDDLAIRIGGPERSALRTPLSIAVFRLPQRFGVGAVLVEDGKAMLFADGGIREDESSPKMIADALRQSVHFACANGMRSSNVEIVTNDYGLYGSLCRYLDGEPVAQDVSDELKSAFARAAEMGVRLSVRLKAIDRDADSGEVGIVVAHDLACFGSKGSKVHVVGADLDVASRFAKIVGTIGRHSLDPRNLTVDKLEADHLELFENWARSSCPPERISLDVVRLEDDTIDRDVVDIYVQGVRGPSHAAYGFLVVDGTDFHAGGNHATKRVNALAPLEGQIAKILDRKQTYQVRLHGSESERQLIRDGLAKRGVGVAKSTSSGIVHSARSQCALVFAEYSFSAQKKFRTGGRVRSLLSEVERYSPSREDEVVVTCDASLGDRSSGFGVVAVHRGKGCAKAIPSGRIDGSEDDRPTFAEAKAAIEGVTFALESFPSVRRIKLVSDSIVWMRVLDQVQRGRELDATDATLKEYAEKLREIAAKNKLFVDWEWTKAHTTGIDRRSVANDLADRLSYAARIGKSFGSKPATHWRGQALDFLQNFESSTAGRNTRRNTVGAMLSIADAEAQSGLDKGLLHNLVKAGHLFADYESGTVSRDSLVRLMDEVDLHRKPRRRTRAPSDRMDIMVSADLRPDGCGYAVFSSFADVSLLKAGFFPTGVLDQEIFDGFRLDETFPTAKEVRFISDDTFRLTLPGGFDEVAHRLYRKGVNVTFPHHLEPEFSTGTGQAMMQAVRDFARRGRPTPFERKRNDGDWVMLLEAADRFLPSLDARPEADVSLPESTDDEDCAFSDKALVA